MYDFMCSKSNISLLFVTTTSEQDNIGPLNADVDGSVFLCSSSWIVRSPIFKPYSYKVNTILYLTCITYIIIYVHRF